jgi:hypothetical protein
VHGPVPKEQRHATSSQPPSYIHRVGALALHCVWTNSHW